VLPIVIIINNYLHDVASAMLLASALVVWFAGRQVERGASPEAFLAAYPLLKRIAWASLTWIVVGGIPRTIFFSRYEWDPASTAGIVPALLVKHVLMVSAVAAGAALWVRMARSVRERAAADGAAS